jgi:hypothetical protein
MIQINPKNIALFCITIGSFLRLAFPYDIEFKYDQKLMLDWIIEFWNVGHFRSIGMMSGGNVPNFGFGVWLFYIIGWFNQTPVGLTMLVALINVFSLLFLFHFINRKIGSEEKDIWYWALSLLSISILPIILSRNIWIQSILPPFSFMIWYLYWSNLSKFITAFLLAFLLVLIGQIHLSGIFLCFIFSLFLFWLHLKESINLNIKAYVLGGAIGALPMIPLILHLINSESMSPASNFNNMKDVRFLWFHIFDGLGLDIFYTLEADTFLFFKYPIINSCFTYVNGILYAAIIVISILGIFYTVRYTVQNKITELFSRLHTNKTFQFIFISFLLYALLYLLRVRIYSHYLIITYPFIQLLAVYLLQRKKALIYGLILFNLFLSVQFMFFIHNTGGTDSSYYGKTYQRMIREQIK